MPGNTPGTWQVVSNVGTVEIERPRAPGTYPTQDTTVMFP